LIENNIKDCKKINYCIYCGKTKNLTKEHIVPKALGGTLVLQNSSCTECNKITSHFELLVNRGFLHKTRTKRNFPTRRKKLRPTTFEVEVLGKNNIKEKLLLDVEQYPDLLTLPIFSQPGIMVDRNSNGSFECSLLPVKFSEKSTFPLLKLFGFKKMWFTDKIKPVAFAKMLAKIAYGFLVCLEGKIPLDEVSVLPFIRGEKEDGDFWVGTSNIEETSKEHGFIESIHCFPIRMKELTILDVVRIKILAHYKIVSYDVIVRKRK
jgi:hypothetical protein